MNRIETGLERFCEAPPDHLKGLRLGLLCNPASVDHRLCHARFRIDAVMPKQLAAIYAPQHGFFAEKQDNMIESGHGRDPRLGLPVFSLYSNVREPTAEMFEPIDVLLVDLQDVGTRVYTFIYTLSYCMEAAARFGKKVIVLDRPNPIDGNTVEGNCLTPDWISFVGRYPLPMRHGLTIGELARMFNREFRIGCELEVVPLRGWHRAMLFSATGLPWVAPSPNLPTPISALVYPGQVLWEGTNVSEGRGTTQPFELFGAPFLQPSRVLDCIDSGHLEGIVLRETVFEPTSNKWAGTACRGFQIHVLDPQRYRPYEISLRLLQSVCRNHADQFEWKAPPYEYEYHRLPIDLIIGDQSVRKQVESGTAVENIVSQWQPQLNDFIARRRNYYLYESWE